LIIPKYVEGKQISHAVLTKGKPVLTAGEADIVGDGGKFIGLQIKPHSGHFRPSDESLQIAIDLFAKLGIKF